MAMNMRDSGIEALGEVSWGAHFCQLYRTREDLIDMLVPYFKAGLENNERCLWVTSDPFRAHDARDLLRAALPSTDARAARGQIEVIDYEDWYVRQGTADAETVLGDWLRKEDEALSSGYAGLRLTGNTYWLERKDWAGFVDYEEKVNRTFRDRTILGLCSYSLDRCTSEGIVDVVRNHEFALIRRDGVWEQIENSSLTMAKEQLRQLNAELERRVAERTAQLVRALRVRDEFLSTASHELKTPLASLQLYLDGLMRLGDKGAIPPDELRKRLQRAQVQTQRLDALVTRRLDLSRTMEGRLPLAFEEVDLTEVLHSVAERHLAGLRDGGCNVDIDARGPVLGRWDRMRIEQVMTNLLSNACKYGAGKPVAASVRADGERAILEVRDQGIGIAPADQERIFERFVQVSPERHPGGFGVGLWIVRQIVDALGGAIAVASGPGAGATFTVTLPRTPPPAPSSSSDAR